MADDATVAAPTNVPTSVDATETPNAVAPTNGDAAAPVVDGETSTGAEPNGAPTDDAIDSADAAAAEADPASTPGSKDKRRKSSGGIPEHKAKKLNKKKSMPTLRLDCKPGEYYWARLKGYPPWPAIVCDEAMLPESLLATRPVSTARPDGSIREDFKEGGKNARERTFPIMFLATNEFQWMINTNLTPLDPEECKSTPNSKMSKSLIEAWKIASENHNLQHFKDILSVWQEEEELIRKQEEEAQAEAERTAAEKAVKAEQDAKDEASKSKKKARKSKAADELADAEGTETPKSSKKRKKDGESDGDGSKPKKTPKVTKLNAPKTPGDEASASKKSAAKAKKRFVPTPKPEEEEVKPQLSEAEKQVQREKAVLYLRHRLQKGFLSRDQAPQDSEMAGMADFFTQLEAYENLEPSILRTTKVHKVLKAIIKLASVPKDDEYHFKKRSAALLELWNNGMEADGDAAPTSAADSKSHELNGDSKTPVPAASKEDEEPKEGAEPEEEKAEENADQIESKVEGEKDATAGPPPPLTEPIVDGEAADAKDETHVDVEMPDASTTA